MLHSLLLKIIDQKPYDRKSFLRAKKIAAAEFHLAPVANGMLIAAYNQLIEAGGLQRDHHFEKLLKKRTIRTASGIACVTVMTKQYDCPGRCAFCPQIDGMPKSYLPDQPAMMRAIRNKFDPYDQVSSRLRALQINGHNTEKIEIRIAGETWSAYPLSYQEEYVKRIFDALNEEESGSLEDAQKKNETAKNRCVGMSIETRPDWINKKEIAHLRKLGVTLIELGVQHTDNHVLDLNLRDHPVETTIAATKMLRDAGFKIVYHTMPNLYGSNLQMDLSMHRELFARSDFRPDQLKIYPCMLLKNTELYTWYEQGKYIPYTTNELTKLLIAIKKEVKEYCRIIRVVRDIPSNNIADGNKVTNIRQMIQQHPDYSCVCIRCREPMGADFSEKLEPVMKITEYEANGGREFFIAYETQDAKTLFGYVRLRLPEKTEHFISELSHAALVRELHVYGMVVGLEEKNSQEVQHKGLGKNLMKAAEKIAKKHGYEKIAVISGIGVRKYYEEKLGYTLEGSYMCKKV